MIHKVLYTSATRASLFDDVTDTDCLTQNSSVYGHLFAAFKSSSAPWPTGLSGGHVGRFSRDPLPICSAGGRCEQFWHGQGCPHFDVVHRAFPLPTTASPTLQGAGVLKDGFGEAVVAGDMPEPCKFPSQLSTATFKRQLENKHLLTLFCSLLCVCFSLCGPFNWFFFFFF